MHRLKNVSSLACIVLLSIVLFLSCTTTVPLVCGDYYSQGDYIIEQSNVDGWRNGHYLLTIGPSNTFVLKEASVDCGMKYTVCSGYLKRQGTNSFSLKKTKKNTLMVFWEIPFIMKTSIKSQLEATIQLFFKEIAGRLFLK